MRLPLAMFAALLPLATPVQAQNGPGPQTYAAQQASQAWATRAIAASGLRREWITIPQGNRTLRALVTYPAKAGKVPVVIVGHEVFGLTDSTISTAVSIARMGVITITPDFLSGYGPGGGGTEALAPRSAGDLSTSLDDDAVDADINAWIAWGKALPRANGKVALVGLSWSGGADFRYILGQHADPAVKAVCVFYDVGPPTSTQGKFHGQPQPGTLPVGHIGVPVYGFYPERDARVMASLPATTAAMRAAGNRFDPVIYPGADHAFMRVGADPANTVAANRAAVAASLARLRRILRGL